MATTYSRASQIARRGKDLANRAKALDRDIQDFLGYNSAESIDWGAGSPPAVLEIDAAGNLNGFDFDRMALANFIGTLAAIDTLLDAGHRGNVFKLADASA